MAWSQTDIPPVGLPWGCFPLNGYDNVIMLPEAASQVVAGVPLFGPGSLVTLVAGAVTAAQFNGAAIVAGTPTNGIYGIALAHATNAVAATSTTLTPVLKLACTTEVEMVAGAAGAYAVTAVADVGKLCGIRCTNHTTQGPATDLRNTEIFIATCNTAVATTPVCRVRRISPKDVVGVATFGRLIVTFLDSVLQG